MTFTGTKTEISQFLFKLDKNTIYDLKIDKHRNKRSLNANAYAWKLITEIGNALRLSKEEVYYEMLKQYGQSEYVCLLANVEPSRISKYYELQGTFKQNGNTFNSYIFFIGSSAYNSKEMSIFIDGLVQEAKNLDIETLEEKELKEMLEEMDKYE